MVKLSTREIIDIVRYGDDKAIFVEKVPSLADNGANKISCFVINFDTGTKDVITKTAYLRQKFGNNYQAIIEKLGDYANFDAYFLPDRNILAVYNDGKYGIFTPDGEVVTIDELKYNDKSVHSVAEDDGAFWSCCEEENCIVRFLADSLNFDIRIGGKESATFANPTFVSADKDYIYVVCNHNYVRQVDKKTFAVSDISKKYDGLKSYYKFGDYSVVGKNDGFYLDKE